MSAIMWTLASTVMISMIAFVGIIALSLRKKLDEIVIILVSLSTGALIGGAFFHLIPEAIESSSDVESVFVYVILGFVVFFLIEKILHWRHCHDAKCKVHTFGYMNLIGDVVHNFLDGMIVAAAWISSFELGLTTTIAIIFHEIPQEIGDFGVLVHSGFKRGRAIVLNFVVALTVVLGGVAGFFLSSMVENFVPFLLPLAAGGFIYIASSDLIPEFRSVGGVKKSVVTFTVFLIGIVLMWAVKYVFA